MKILLLNCVYQKGSTGKIVYDLHSSLLEQGHSSVVCYGRGQKINAENVYKCCGELYAKFNNLLSRFTGLMYGGCAVSTHALFRIIDREKPDVVHIHCINGYFVNIYRLITFLKKRRIKTVLTLHAEFMHTGNCGYSLECDNWKTGCGNCPRLRAETKSIFLDNTALSWRKMKKAFEGFEDLVVTSVSPWLQERAQVSPILAGKNHVTILNGLDTTVFQRDYDSALRREFGIENKKVVFHATASFSTEKDHIKGGIYVVEMAKRFLETDKDVVFVVAGPCANTADMPSNMVFLGNISDQKKLAQWYSAADVTLLASKKETFSMVVAESLCCGTPVVGFEAGAPEMITIKEFSSFLPYGQSDRMFDALNLYLYSHQFDRKAISSQAMQKYSKESMVKQYQKVYEEIIKSRES